MFKWVMIKVIYALKGKKYASISTKHISLKKKIRINSSFIVLNKRRFYTLKERKRKAIVSELN